ncbi:phosphotransferase [Flexivirga endophytica]|nr:phosphotransferase [Flexivirga endophytica]
MEDDFDDGWDMSAKLVDGRWVERSPRHPALEPQARRETQFLPWLAPQLPLPVPIPVIVAEEPLVLRHAYLPGQRCPGTSAAHGRAVGSFLRALHAIDADAAMAHGLRDADSAHTARRETGDRMAREVLPRLPDGVHTDGEHLLARLAHLPADPCVVHADLGLDHIRVTGEEVSGIIDWGDSCVGDPAIDLSATTLSTGPMFARGVLETYRPAREVLARARDWHMLSPWHEVLFGLDTQHDELISSGLTEAIARLKKSRARA